tara:strand:+ start:105 stop:422 length:318 start_codon:yes stop_codon:yes gene_type:complete
MNGWNSYFEYLEHWERHDTAKKINNKLLSIVVRANWNKRILCGNNFEPSASDLETHRNRFNHFIMNTKELSYQLKLININYNPKRINTIIESLTKLKNYENKRTG